MRENLISNFGHRYPGPEMEVSGQTAEDIRRQIPARMAEAGLAGDADVQGETTPWTARYRA